MIRISENFLGISKAYKDKLLVTYYNEKVLPLVKRKYAIKTSDDWCAMFVSVIAHKFGLTDFPFEVSCYYQMVWGKDKGVWHGREYTPKPNDLIYYDWGRGNRINHVGIVVSVNGDALKVIEGNKGGTVAYRNIDRLHQTVKGFISLDLDSSDVHGISLDELIKRTLRGEYGNGNERKQALGSRYDEVQKAINNR